MNLHKSVASLGEIWLNLSGDARHCCYSKENEEVLMTTGHEPSKVKSSFQQTLKCHKALCQTVQQQVLVVEIIHFLDWQ